MQCFNRYCIAVVIGIFSLSSAVSADIIKREPEEVIKNADVVVHGNVKSMESIKHPTTSIQGPYG